MGEFINSTNMCKIEVPQPVGYWHIPASRSPGGEERTYGLYITPSDRNPDIPVLIYRRSAAAITLLLNTGVNIHRLSRLSIIDVM